MPCSQTLNFQDQIHGIWLLQRFVPQFEDRIVNAFDVEAWQTATTLSRLSVRLVVRHGAVTVALEQVDRAGQRTRLDVLHKAEPGTARTLPIALAELSGSLLPVIIEKSEDAVFDVLFVSDDHPANPALKVNYVFCTFKRADYVQANTDVFRDYLRRDNAEAQAHLTIVDNGSTAGENDCGVVTDAHVTVLPNDNTGGAGGFGRGMYETCYGALAGHGFTHVCLMDDDIALHPEMFTRNTAFLRFLRPGFHVGAPMYPMTGGVKVPRKSSTFGHKYANSDHPSDHELGAGLDTHDLAAFIAMDREPDTTGWWWDCIAVADIVRVGLPYPFFIKMDDVEFGLRLKAAGVRLVVPYSFWVLHDDFTDKYNAGMQYFRFRNRLVMRAGRGELSPADQLVHYVDKEVRTFVRTRRYEHAELFLNAVTQFLEGPKALLQNAESWRAAAFGLVRDEKNVPLSPPGPDTPVVNDLPPPTTPRRVRLTELTWNNHFLPLRERVYIDTSQRSTPTATRRAKKVTFWTPGRDVGFTVTRDSRRAFWLMLRLRALRKRIPKELDVVAEQYRTTWPHLISPEFWSLYGPFGESPPLTPDPKLSAQMAAHRGLAESQAEILSATSQPAPFITSDAALIECLRNRYQGQRCFIIGNGPSLRIEDLEALRGEVTFASNKIYLSFDETTWRPTFYSVEDRLVARNNADRITALTGMTKIFPHHMLPLLPRQPNHAYVRWLPPHDNTVSFREFSTDLAKGVCWGSTITYTLMQMAVHMGFRQIYLLGLDHTYIEPKTTLDGVLVSEGERNHFHPDYRKPGEQWHLPVLDRLEWSYGYAKTACDALGVEVWNASRKTALDTFPRANLDVVLGKKAKTA